MNIETSVLTIESNKLKKLLQKDEIYLIDVRERYENEEIKIENSINIPLKELNNESLSKFIDKDIVFYCKSGKRSEVACYFMQEMNLKNKCYNLIGGIESWINVKK